jgi:hypothetical protein
VLNGGHCMGRIEIRLLKAVVVLGFACGVTLTHVQAQALETDRTSGCRFLRPAELASGATVWFGECRNNLANGAGVLRVTVAGTQAHFFFGTMASGRPQRGVVTQDTNDDVIAWRFDGTHAAEPIDRAQTAEVYAAAAAGAAEAAKRFEAKGNTSSSKYYGNWSRTLKAALSRGE